MNNQQIIQIHVQIHHMFMNSRDVLSTLVFLLTKNNTRFTHNKIGSRTNNTHTRDEQYFTYVILVYTNERA